MYTTILKSLATAYIVIAMGASLISLLTAQKMYLGEMVWQPPWEHAGEMMGISLIMPLIFWPATLIVSVIAFLVFKAIEEHKK